MIIKTKALVIRAISTGDNDRTITLLSQDLGVISVSVRGAARGKSRLSAVAQPLMYGEYVLFVSKSKYTLNEAEVIASFFNLASEPEQYETAIQLLRYATDAAHEPGSAAEILELTLRALHYLNPDNKKRRDRQLISAIYLLKLIQISGLTPHVTGCVKCGTKAIDSISFSFQFRGFLCEECKAQDEMSMSISQGTAKAILYTLCSPITTLFHFELDENLIMPFYHLVYHYLEIVWFINKPNKVSFFNE